MSRAVLCGVAVSLVALVVFMNGQAVDDTFSPYVDGSGNISVPKDYRRWVFLGSWHIAPEAGSNDAAGAQGFHNVYAEASTVEHYRRTGTFPDGATLVKELLTSRSGRLTTGNVTWGTAIEGWFVMVKDTKGRFPTNPLWGGGWGWSLFNAANADETVSRNWRTDCSGCHIPARQTDWVFSQGYPILQRVSK